MNSAGGLYPCEPWPIDPTCCPGFPEDPADWQPEHFRAQELATIMLWRAVAGAVGLCKVTEAPCMDSCTDGLERYMSGAYMLPYIWNGSWYNDAGSCGCRGTCSCSRMCTATLQGPVWRIREVTVGDETLTSDQWVLLTGNRIARVDGCWPSCQDYLHGGTFRVMYEQGVPPGPDAIQAVSLLACKKLAECPPPTDGDCGDLPSRVTSINREGLSMTLATDSVGPDNPLSFTGLSKVDSWIASINPYGITSQASVWTPDVPMPVIWEKGPLDA